MVDTEQPRKLEAILLFCANEDIQVEEETKKGMKCLYEGLKREVGLECFGAKDELHKKIDTLLELANNSGLGARIVVAAPMFYTGTLDKADHDGVAEFYLPYRTVDDVSIIMVGDSPNLDSVSNLHEMLGQDNLPGERVKVMHTFDYLNVGRELFEAHVFEDAEPVAAVADPAAEGSKSDIQFPDVPPPGVIAQKADPEKKAGSKRGLYIGLAALGGIAVLALVGKGTFNVGYNEGFDEFTPQVRQLEREKGMLLENYDALFRKYRVQGDAVETLTEKAADYALQAADQIGSLTSENTSLQETVRTQQADIASRDQQLGEDATRISDITTSGEQCNTDLGTCRGELQAVHAAAAAAAAAQAAAPRDVANSRGCRYSGFRCNYGRAEYLHSSDVLLPGGNRQPSSTGHRHR